MLLCFSAGLCWFSQQGTCNRNSLHLQLFTDEDIKKKIFSMRSANRKIGRFSPGAGSSGGIKSCSINSAPWFV